MQKPDIPDFEFKQCCGSGAYGDVWLALDHNGILRAVKVLNIVRLRNQGVLKREETALQLFRSKVPEHPHLIRIYHVGQTEEYIYYVMDPAANFADSTTAEYIPDTLAHRLDRDGAISVENTVELISGILEAVECLHSAGLVHRDIKPSNILFIDGVSKLADIGLAASPGTSLSVAGTINFIPPEKSSGPEADLYAVGKLLYCCFTGASADQFPSIPEGVNVDNVSFLNQVALKACAKKPEERFADISEFKAAIEGDKAKLKIKHRFLSIRMTLIAVAVFAVLLLIFNTVMISKNELHKRAVVNETVTNANQAIKDLNAELDHVRIEIDEPVREQLMHSVELELQRNHPENALIYLDKIKKRWPDWIYKSDEYMKLHDSAVSMKKHSEALGGKEASRKMIQAAVLLESDPQAALRLMEEVWKNPATHKKAAMISMYAKALVANGKADEALKTIELQMGLPDKQEVLNAYFERSNIFLKLNRYSEALDDANHLLKAKPDKILYITQRAIIYQQMGNKDKALKDMKHALELDPENIMIKQIIDEMKGGK